MSKEPSNREPLAPAENWIAGRNPIKEALKSGRDMEKLLVAQGELTGAARDIVRIAKDRHIPVMAVDRRKLDEMMPHHQGMIAVVSAYSYATVEDMLALARQREEHPFVIVLDGITDPHNLGAIIRTAECVGAHGVILPQRRAAGLTPAAVKASAGAVEYLPVARVPNIVRELDALKEAGLWIVGSAAADAAENAQPMSAIDLKGALALVIGAEGEGLSRLALEHCDFVASIPLRGRISSLNASVAAAVLMYEALRQRSP